MRFREQILADLLDNAYGMMRSRYLVEIGGALGGAWRILLITSSTHTFNPRLLI